ncbi:MAG: methylated-DNA--[protein]-cysteine S-methyltransferase [Burkholderiaceae bacterium]|nr:methylated-DNA--[protein]-cysteine S-methyltransferase [Burkholderiaceae bacterium]
MISYCEYVSPLGSLLLVASERGLCGIYFEQHRHFKGKADDWHEKPDQEVLTRTRRQLGEFFAGTRQAFDLPFDLRGTPFQHAVWDALLAIPFGATISYGEHARRVGKPAAVRAVGAAIGRNPVSIIVPCHRVVASSGAHTGYAGGLERKRRLLAFEAGAEALA